jgi:hypothetical protein
VKCDCKMINPPDGRKKRNMLNSGMAKDPTYKIWIGVRTRCREGTLRNSQTTYRHVKISESWAEEYSNFLCDMGERPGKQMSIDRIDGNRGYCAHNCRWATRYEQAMNRRGIDNTYHVSEGIRKRRSGAFEARIAILGRMFHIGTFKTHREAGEEYKKYREYIDTIESYQRLQNI